jgi:acyl-CoA synthetase (AMP-forming)/AMP-acid ligase II
MWLYADIANVADVVRFYGKTQATKVALLEGSKSITFGDLDQITNRIAMKLITEGVRPRESIGFVGKNSIVYFEVLFAANKARSHIVPINWRLSPREIADILADALPALVFVEKDFEALIRDARELCPHKFEVETFDPTQSVSGGLETWSQSAESEDPTFPLSPSDVAALIYTSGTTGKPKGVMLTQNSFCQMRLCEHLEPALSWKPNDVMMMVMPNFHLVGTGLALQSLYNGSTVSILPAMDAQRLRQTIQRDRPTICVLVPTAIQMLLDHPDAAHTDFSSLRLVMYAGSPIDPTLLKRALKTMNCEFMQFYGATETCGAVTLLRPEHHFDASEERLKSCGTPLPLITVKIMDSDGNELEEGKIGELWIRSPALTPGYWQQPDATAAAFVKGWYRSGDAGFKDSAGLLYIVDRVKDMIVTGGENVYSTEVEQALMQHPAVRQCAVIGLPDPKWGERVVAVVVRAAGAEVSSPDLIAHCRTLIGGYKVPKEVAFADALPMTATGKILKRALRDNLIKERATAASQVS